MKKMLHIPTGSSNEEHVYHRNKISDLDVPFLRGVTYISEMLSWLLIT